jgi:hypothetical protein
MSHHHSIFGILLIGMAAVLFLGSGLLAQEIKIKTENGIPVVYNPKEPVPVPGIASQITLQQDLVLGGESEGQEYLFSLLSFLVVDDDENMIVLDREESCIKIFDKNGKKIQQFGRKGEGPGEFQRPTTLAVIKGEKIGVMDPPNHRYSIFSREGECLKEISLEKYARLIRVRADSRGFFYANYLTVVDAQKNIKYTMDLIKFDQDFKPVLTLGSFEFTRKRREVIMVEKRFGFYPRDDNSFAWGINGAYVINIVSTNGETIRRIVKDYDPVKVTEEDRQEMYKDTFGEQKLPSDVSLNFPKYYPPFYGFLCDDEGRIHVWTYEKDPQGNIFYDVFTREGKCFTRYSLPNKELLFAVKKNKVYSINNTDFPVLTRYTMIWH